MKYILIYDTGKQYALEVDPDNLPDWVLRALELNENIGGVRI